MIAILSFVFLTVPIVNIFVVDNKVTSILRTENSEELDKVISISEMLLDATYPGDWEVKGDDLFKGETLINTDCEIVQNIYNESGTLMTLSLGDVRVATNIKDKNGKNEVGTKLPNDVWKVVSAGNNYHGNVNLHQINYMSEYVPIYDKDNNVIGALFVGIPEAEIQKHVLEMFLTLVVALLILAILELPTVVLFIRNIMKSFREISRTLEAVALGDLTVKCEVYKNDDFGVLSDNLNLTINILKTVISEVEKNAVDVSNYANMLKDNTHQTEISAQDVAKVVEEIANATTSIAQDMDAGVSKSLELEKGIDNVVDALTDVELSISKTYELKEKGTNLVQDLSVKSKSSKEVVTLVGNTIKEMENRTRGIEEFVNKIDAIASQTNLLSLNASIEAARAGEHGRGFAVVAEEIRKLAENTSETTVEIKELVSGIINNTNETASIMGEVTKNTDVTLESAVNVGDLFDEINSSLVIFKEKTDKINDCSKTMTTCKTEIMGMIQNTSVSSQETAATSEEISASSEEQLATVTEVKELAEILSGVAEALKEKINKFKV